MSEEIKGLIKAMEHVERFIVSEYGDPKAQALEGELLAHPAREPHAKLCEAITALERLSGRVRVKPLTFDRYGEAIGLGGKYAVYEGGGGFRALFYPTSADPKEVLIEAGTEAQAYGMTNKHHETRILAALEPAPTPDAREKALREAADIAGKYHDEAKREILSLIRTTGGSHE